MERIELEKIIETSLEEFFKNEQDLIDVDANERSISHKIAESIQKNFPDWNVDCEYNRTIDYKNTKNIPKRLQPLVESTYSDDECGKTVFPDIIIHKRKQKENLLIIEIKKSGLDYDYDREKIKAFLEDENFSYKFGLMLIINMKKDIKKKYETFWFPIT